MKKTLGGAAVLLMLAAGGTGHAQSYDGKWLVVIPPTTARCPSVQLHVVVAGRRIREEAGTVLFTYHLAGTLAPDGSFDISSPGGTGHSKGKFSGDALAADFTNSQCGTRSGAGHREP